MRQQFLHRCLFLNCILCSRLASVFQDHSTIQWESYAMSVGKIFGISFKVNNSCNKNLIMFSQCM